MILYISEPGSYLKKSGNRIVIEKDRSVTGEIQIEKLEAVIIFSGVQISSPLITFLLEKGIPMTWLSSNGSFYGRLEPTSHINIERQRNQFRAAEDKDFALALAKSFIMGKVRNSGVLLRRYNRTAGHPGVDSKLDQMGQCYLKLEKADSLEQLLGYEGMASRLYFTALGEVVKEDFRFAGRTRQPPLDPFNSLLSFGYTLLIYDVYTAIINRGLHPYMAFLHQIRHGHPALASDLMEEWRAVIVDSLVLSLVQGHSVDVSQFETDSAGGVYMGLEYRKNFINAYEKKLRQSNSYLPYITHPVDYRESIQEQAMCLARAVDNKNPDLYRPVIIR